MPTPTTSWTQTLPAPVQAMAWSGDGRLAVSAGEQLVVMDAGGHRQWRLDEAGARCLSLAWSPDSRRLAGARLGVRVFDGTGGQLVLGSKPTFEQRVAWSRDGAWLFTATSGGLEGQRRRVLCRQASDLAVGWERRLSKGDDGVESLAVLGDGSTLVVGDVEGDAGKLVVLDAVEGRVLSRKAVRGLHRVLAATRDGRTLAVGAGGGVRLLRDKGDKRKLVGSCRVWGAELVTSLAWSPVSAVLAAAVRCEEGQLRLVLLRQRQGEWEHTVLEGIAPEQLAWSPDGAVLVAATSEGLHALDGAVLFEGSPEPWPRPARLKVGLLGPREQAARRKRQVAVRRALAEDLIGTFGNVMVSEGEERGAEAEDFNSLLDRWFSRYPNESVASVALLIAGSLAARNPDLSAEEAYPMVMRDLLSVRESGA